MNEELKKEVLKMSHENTIEGMEMIKNLMVKFGNKFTIEMANFAIKDYKEHFKNEM